ncbi:MAG: hypothetical protein ACJ8LG_02880 [Massilia sp.]
MIPTEPLGSITHPPALAQAALAVAAGAPHGRLHAGAMCMAPAAAVPWSTG